MLGLLPFLYIFLTYLTRVYAIAEAPNFLTFQTDFIGNISAAKYPVKDVSTSSTVRKLEVYWDSDKIRGLIITRFDGSTVSAGGSGGIISTFEFSKNEAFASVILTSSGWGYGSFRQWNFTTSIGNFFTAGANGYDSILYPPLTGAYMVGFTAWVNVDDFINAFAIDATLDPSSL